MSTTEQPRAFNEVDRSKPLGSAWIQWKGTNVCMDVHCPCGHHSHVDADFAYYYQCSNCHQVYEVCGDIHLIPLTQAATDDALRGPSVVHDMDWGLRPSQP